MNKDLNITEDEYNQITSEPKIPIKLNKKNGNVIFN